MWAGLLVAFWLLLLFVAVIYCYMHDLDLSRASAAYARHNATIDAGTVAQYYWHNSAVGVGAAALGMVFIVGGVGLILGARWAWPVLVGGAGLQICSPLPPRSGKRLYPHSGITITAITGRPA
jgi:hypothetical protein